MSKEGTPRRSKARSIRRKRHNAKTSKTTNA